MKEKIVKVLGEFGEQVNLASSAAKNAIADKIIEELNKPSRAKQAVDFGNDESKWICEYCGGNTWDVYNDYMGSGTNHLKCELEEEMNQCLRIKNWTSSETFSTLCRRQLSTYEKLQRKILVKKM